MRPAAGAREPAPRVWIAATGRLQTTYRAGSAPMSRSGSGVVNITYVPTWTGFVYLAIVLDVFSRMGCVMALHLRTELVHSALNMAIGQRRPKEVIHHSDKGAQYTSSAFGKCCRETGVLTSTGRPGMMEKALLPPAVAHFSVATAFNRPRKRGYSSGQMRRQSAPCLQNTRPNRR